jgi:large subunit ribosomal protein L23
MAESKAAQSKTKAGGETPAKSPAEKKPEDAKLAPKGAAKKGAPKKVESLAARLELAPHQVVLRPLVTEKGMHRSTRLNQYAFEVSPLADKDLIRQSIESLFNVTVIQVRTQNRKGKSRRHRFRHGRTKDWKKAIVTLDKEHRIDFF